MKELTAIDTVEEQMGFLIQRKVSILATAMRYPDQTNVNVLRAVKEYQLLKKQGELDNKKLSAFVCLELFGDGKSSTSPGTTVLHHVFGNELQPRGGSYALMHSEEEKRLVKWNESIGLPFSGQHGG